MEESKRLYTSEEVAAIIGLTLQSTRKLINEDGVYICKTPVRDKTTGKVAKTPRLYPDGTPVLNENGEPIMETVYKTERKKGIRATKVGRSYLVTSDAIRDYLGGDFEAPSYEQEYTVAWKKWRQKLLPEAKKEAQDELYGLGVPDPKKIEMRTEQILNERIKRAIAAERQAAWEAPQTPAQDETAQIPSEMLPDLTRILKAVKNGRGATSQANREAARNILEHLEQRRL